MPSRFGGSCIRLSRRTVLCAIEQGIIGEASLKSGVENGRSMEVPSLPRSLPLHCPNGYSLRPWPAERRLLVLLLLVLLRVAVT